MNKPPKIFLPIIALLVITDSYAGVADGLDKRMNPQEPVVQKPNVNLPIHTHKNPKTAVPKKRWKNHDPTPLLEAPPTIAVTVPPSNQPSPTTPNPADIIKHLQDSWGINKEQAP